MSKMTIIVHCHSTNIHRNLTGFHGFEWNFFPAAGIMYSERHMKQALVLAITLEGYRYDSFRHAWSCNEECEKWSRVW